MPSQEAICAPDPEMRQGGTFIGSLLRLLGLSGLACAMSVPFCWMIMTSLKPLDEIERPNFVPSQWRADNYAAVLGRNTPKDVAAARGIGARCIRDGDQQRDR